LHKIAVFKQTTFYRAMSCCLSACLSTVGLCAKNTYLRRWTWSSAFNVDQRLSSSEHTRRPALCTAYNWTWGSIARLTGATLRK